VRHRTLTYRFGLFPFACHNSIKVRMHITYPKLTMPIMCASYLISDRLANMQDIEINVVDKGSFSFNKAILWF